LVKHSFICRSSAARVSSMAEHRIAPGEGVSLSFFQICAQVLLIVS
jgi:hypothetical protein